MKLCGVPILVLLLSLGAASGQQTQPRATQSTANAQALKDHCTGAYTSGPGCTMRTAPGVVL